MDFIQLLFGEDKREIWQHFSRLTGGEFIDGGFWGTDKLKIPYRNWTIVFESLNRKIGRSQKLHTRSQVVFKKRTDFVFIIFPDVYFGYLEKQSRQPTIITHFDDIDDHYIVKGNKDLLIQEFLSDQSIRQLLKSVPFYSFTTKEFDSFDNNNTNNFYEVLYIETTEETESVHNLNSILSLSQATLDKLVGMNLISLDKPTI